MQLTYGLVAVLVGSLLLAGCGGEDGADSIERNGEGGLFFGLYQEARSSTDPNPRNIGGLYLNVPNGNGLYFGQASFQFNPVCQLVNALPILGDKLGSSLSGASGGVLDNPLIPSSDDQVAFSMPANYFFDGRSYGGNYTRLNVTANQTRRTSECSNTNYNLAPNGAWVSHMQGTRFPSNFTLLQANTNQVTWLPVTSDKEQEVPRSALVMLLDASKLEKSSDNAIVSQVVQQTSATLLNSYTLVSPSTFPKNYIVVVQLLNAQGQLVGFDDLSVRF
ncbi:MAG: hypothetical protein ACEQSD_08265 [Flavobacteriales bacterium]